METKSGPWRARALAIARDTALDWLRHRDVVPMELVSDLAALDVLDESARETDAHFPGNAESVAGKS
jgi:DNA-directed RNA polymerase specialized sigma24 family protein